jgi:uridine kinase
MLSFTVAAEAVSVHLEQLPAVQRPRFVAIDGLSCAGKTTFASYLAEAVGGTVLHTDDLAHKGPDLWDHERFTRQIWQRLSHGLTARCQLQHWSQEAPGGEIELPPETRIVVLEGIRSLDRAVTCAWDVRLWVSVDEDTRLNRARQREGGTRWDCWSTNWLPKEQEYVRVQEPHESAHFLVAGDTLPAAQPLAAIAA